MIPVTNYLRPTVASDVARQKIVSKLIDDAWQGLILGTCQIENNRGYLNIIFCAIILPGDPTTECIPLQELRQDPASENLEACRIGQPYSCCCWRSMSCSSSGMDGHTVAANEGRTRPSGGHQRTTGGHKVRHSANERSYKDSEWPQGATKYPYDGNRKRRIEKGQLSKIFKVEIFMITQIYYI